MTFRPLPLASAASSAALLLSLAAGCGGPPPADPSSTGGAAQAPSGEPASTSSAAPVASGTASPQSGELIGVPIADNKQGGSAPADAGGGGAQSVELVYIESKADKGAPKKLLFDVTLRNARTEPRWYLLPAVVSPQEKMMKSGVDGVDLFTLKGEPRVVVGRFSGKGAFHAVLLPAGAELKVEKLPIECHFNTVKECAVPIEVVIAGKLTVGGEPAEKWLGDKPLSDGKGSVLYEGGAKRTGGKKAGGSKEVSVEDLKRVKLTLVVGG